MESSSPIQPAPQVQTGPSRENLERAAQSPIFAPETKLPPPRRLRLWPGVVLVGLQLLAITVPGLFTAGLVVFMAKLYAPMVCAAGLALWWLFASRLSIFDRCLGFVAFGASAGLAMTLCHPSFRGMPLIIYALPGLTTAWVLWLLLTFFLPWPVRRVGLVVAMLLTAGYFTLLRFDGVDGNFAAALNWRWTPTSEDKYKQYLANLNSAPAPAPIPEGGEKLTSKPGDWPGFRGPNRDGRCVGEVIDADWAASPPRELWRKPVGPGWSSFAVVGDRLYTQEQRGENEAVVCMEADTGKEIWAHLDDKRFSEPVAGAGPRATPTFHDGRIYAQGATGVLNCLDARTGAKIWSADIAKDSGAAVPMWGFSASPLVLQGLVIVFAGGPGGKAVHAYKADTGEAAWAAGEGKLSYCSPQAAKIGGVEQILFCTEKGLVAFSPTGGVLWQNDWAVDAPRVVQPALVGDSDVLLGTGMGNGTRRVHVEGSGTDWKTSEVWLTKDFKPYFNDLVIAKGHLYGFDGEFFTCVDLEKGEKRWKARGYGSGQVLLLAEQNLLLVLSEKGEVALLEANPQKRVELPGKFQAIQGKTWNHPVVAHGKLFVRNGEEMACYKVGK